MIYIGHFSYNDEMDDKDSFVLMPLIVSAEDADEAMEKFADHLLDVHSHSDLLEGAGQIYLDTLVELEEVPTEPIITQWQKIVPAADGLCSITGALPAVEKDFEDGVAYAWGDDEDDDELELEELADLSEDDLTQAYEEEPFLQFLSEDDQ